MKFLVPPMRLCNIFMIPPTHPSLAVNWQSLFYSPFFQILLVTTDLPWVSLENHATPPPRKKKFPLPPSPSTHSKHTGDEK